jgi:hypothetical protein
MVWERLDDDGTYYTTAEVNHALNVGQRLWALLTLCIEHTFAFLGVSGQPFASDAPLGAIAPIQMSYLDSNEPVRVTSDTLHNFAARSTFWRTETGTPKRYAWSGWDLIAVNPTISGNFLLTVAREPFAMTPLLDSPDIAGEQQIHLVDFAIAFLRLKEGGQEMANAMEYMKRFLDAAEKYSKFSASRTQGQGYDRVMPVDLAKYDRGRLDIAIKAQKVIQTARMRQSGEDNGRIM